MKKTMAVMVAAICILALASALVSAAPSERPMAAPAWTETQKADMAPLISKASDLHKQMFEVRKEMLQKQVAFGYLTQDQADLRIARMQERVNGEWGMRGGQGGRGYYRGGCWHNQSDEGLTHKDRP